MPEKLFKKSKRDCTIKIRQHCIETNVQLLCPFPYPRLAYSVQWRCLHAAGACTSIHSRVTLVPISLPSLLNILDIGAEILLGRSRFCFLPMGIVFTSLGKSTYPRTMAMPSVCLQWPLLIPIGHVQNHRFVLCSTIHRH